MSEKLVSLRKICLNLNTLTFASTQILLFTLFPVLSEKLHLSLSTIVACFSLGTILFLWGSPFWSNQSDKIGKQAVMSFGLLGLGLSFSLIVLLLHFPKLFAGSLALMILLLSRIIYGGTASGIIPIAQMMRADMAKKGEHMKSMFSHSLSLSLGRTLGPLLLLMSVGKIETLLFVLSVWSFILLALNLFLSSKEEIKPTFKEEVSAKNEWKESVTQIFWPLLITILFTMYTGILHSSLGGTLQKTFSLTSLDASTLMAKVLLTGSLVMTFVQITGRFLVKSSWRKTLLIGIAFLLAGATLLARLSNYYEVWGAITLISIGIALIGPGNMTILHENGSDKNLGKRVGLLSSGNIIGYALGGSVTTLFMNSINQFAVIIVVALLLVILKTCRTEKV